MRWRHCGKIEADPTLKGKAKEASEAARSPAFQPTEEESEYNPTPHIFITTQQTPIPSTHPTHFPSAQPGHTAAPTPAATLPTTQIPYNIPTTLHTTHFPPYNSQYLPTTQIPLHNLTFTFPAMINHPIPSHHDRRPAQPANQEPQPARTNIIPADPPLRGTINTISGGFARGGSTSSARKKHLRDIQSINHITHSHHKRRMPPIIFTDDDFHGLDHQQDDRMVITVEIVNYVVKKVLVDQGSSVDIFY